MQGEIIPPPPLRGPPPPQAGEEKRGATLLHIPNPLMPEVGAQMIDIAPGLTVTAAIARAELQLRYSTVLCRNGELVKRCDWDIEPIIDGEIISLVTLPQGGGQGGGSQILGTIAMIALAAISYATGAWVADSPWLIGELGSTFAANAVGAIAAGIVMVAGQALLSAMLPGPKRNELNGPDYALFSNANSARIGYPIPEMFGTFMRYPDLASVPYSDWQDNRQHLYQLFCVGIGEYQIDQMRVGQTVVWQNGALTGNYADFNVQIVPPGGTVTLFPGEVQTSIEVQNIQMLGTNQAGYGWIGPFVVNAAGTSCSQIDIDIGWPGGLYSVDGSGHISHATCSFNFQAQLINAAGAAIGPWFNLGISHPSVAMASRDAQYETLVCDVPPGRYQVQGQRTNPSLASSSVSDLLIWVALRGFIPGPTTFPDCTMIAVRAAPAQNLNSTSASEFNVIATRMLPIYDPVHLTWSANTATRTISAAAAYLCKTDNAANLPDSQIDLQTLFGTLEPIWSGRGDYCDGVWDSRGTFWDALTQVLRCGRTMPVLAGEVISFVRDQQQTVYRTAFSPRNMLAGSFQIDYMPYTYQTPDAVWITYMDNRIWQMNTIFCALPDSSANMNDPTIPQITWQGITDRSHAWREGIYTAAASRYRRAFPSWRTELDGRLCFKGDLVKVSHWMPQWGWSAEVLSCTANGGGDILVLSEPWDVPSGDSGDTLLCALTTPDGKVYGPVTFNLLNDGSTTRQAQIQLTTTMNPGGRYAGQIPSAWPSWSGDGLQEERPQAMIGVASTIQKDCLVMQMRPERGQTATVVAVIDDARVYSADGSGPPTETNPPSGVSPENLTITGLVITRTTLSSGAVIMYVTVVGAPDAVSFTGQWMWSDATSYNQPVKGLLRTFQFQAEAAAALTLKVQAVGEDGFGNTFTGTATSTGGGGSSTSAEDFASIVNLAGLATHLQFALDAGSTTSYGGTGYTWTDLTSAGNSFYLGSSGSAGSGDPAFHGTAGALAATDYFSSDGTDFFTLSVANPAWVQGLHQNNGNFSVAAIVYFPGLTPPGSGNAFARFPLFKTCADTGSYGVAVELWFEASSGPVYQGYIQVIKNVSDASIGNVASIWFNGPGTTPIAAGWYFAAVSVNQSANIVTINVNGVANSLGGGLTMTSSADSHNADLTLCMGTAAEPIAANGRIACAGAFDVPLAASDLAALYAQVKQYRGDFALP